MLRIIVGIFASALAIGAVDTSALHAQQKVSIGLVTPTTPKDSPELFAAFNAEKAVLDKALSTFPTQPKWTWVIFPDEASWKAFTHHINIDGDGPSRSYYGQTDQDGHVTYLRGWTLLHPDDDRALPMHVIAHELAYPYLGTHSLKEADDLSVQWVRHYTSEPARSALTLP